jgi:hypothetical protein
MHTNMFGEMQKPILPHPRSVEYSRAPKDQIPISSTAQRARSTFLPVMPSLRITGIFKGAHALALLMSAVVVGQITGAEPTYIPPHTVQVLPVFLVPTDEVAPSADQKARLQRHLTWAQQRYYEMLNNRDTFTIAPGEPLVINGQYSGPAYDGMPEGAAPQFVSEVLTALQQTRFNAPYVFFIVAMNTRNGNPAGGGRPLNGGFNTGAGMVEVSSWDLDKTANFQSTVQHELGHAFGLCHTDAYGYSMDLGASIMSYNLSQHTSGFNPSPTPGILIPEDIRGLALNRRVFPCLFFDPGKDISPSGYLLADYYTLLGPQTVPGQPDYVIEGTTPSGEAYGSSLSRMLNGQIKPNWGWTSSGFLLSTTNASTFDSSSMWHSESQGANGWVSMDITFPVAVSLTRIAIYSQHSGRYNMAVAGRVQVQTNAQFVDVVSQPLTAPDATMDFSETLGLTWRIWLQSGSSGYVVVRGLRYFNHSEEIFPHPVPVFDNAAPGTTNSALQVGISAASRLDMHLEVGLRYQVQFSTDLSNWLPLGNPFIATTNFVSNYYDNVGGRRFWRVAQIP